jgi:hypothetical protein
MWLEEKHPSFGAQFKYSHPFWFNARAKYLVQLTQLTCPRLKQVWIRFIALIYLGVFGKSGLVHRRLICRSIEFVMLIQHCRHIRRMRNVLNFFVLPETKRLTVVHLHTYYRKQQVNRIVVQKCCRGISSKLYNGSRVTHRAFDKNYVQQRDPNRLGRRSQISIFMSFVL